MIAFNNLFDSEDFHDDSREISPDELAGSCILANAADSPWMYLIILKCGMEFEFTSLEVHGDFVQLQNVQRAENFSGKKISAFIDVESIEIRISEIMLIAEFIRDD